MMKSITFGLLASLSTVMAQIQYRESGSGLTFDLLTTTSGSSTDLHFNMSIPASNGWGAIGIGDAMTDALMFVLLPDSTNGSTISVRSASGHYMPTPLSGISLEIVSASAQNNVLMASAICMGCNSWSDGSFSASNTRQSFVYAIGPGTSGVMGSGQNAQISYHSTHGNFIADLTQAAAASTPSSDSGNGTTLTPASGSGSGSGSGTGSHGITGEMTVVPPSQSAVTAHAVLLGLAFGVLMPLAVVLLRIPSMGWKPHAAVQTVALIFAVAGMGVAINMSVTSTEFSDINTSHQRLGIASVSIIIIQAVLGGVHHAMYKKQQKRSIVSYMHINVGRIVMALGIINLILGFQLFENTTGAIAVGVVGFVVYFAAFGTAFFLERRQTRSVRMANSPHSSDGEVVERHAIVAKHN